MNYNKHIWEGWTVQDFIDELEPQFNSIQFDGSWLRRPFETREEVKKWCMSEQPYYKKYIKEVVDYFFGKAVT